MPGKNRTIGIPDAEFERIEGVPITKEEIRVIQISKARIRPGATVYDVGCGSGSISVESAIQTGDSGSVFAVDMDEAAVSLTRRNLARFGIENTTIIHGDALDSLDDLPDADAIIVGGTGGKTADIIRLCRKKLVSGGRMVVGIILIETLYSALQAIAESGFEDIDVIQVAISRGKKTSTGTMMLARNPVAIISATMP